MRDDKKRNLKETVRCVKEDQNQEDKIPSSGVRSPANRSKEYRMRKRKRLEKNPSIIDNNTLATGHPDQATVRVKSQADRSRQYRMRKRENASVINGNTLVTQDSDQVIPSSRVKSPVKRSKEYRMRKRLKKNPIGYPDQATVRVKSPADRSKEYRSRKRVKKIHR